MRHGIKPGITGWAQVNGWSGNTETEEKIRKRVEYNLYDIKHRSLWFNIKIVVLKFFLKFYQAATLTRQHQISGRLSVFVLIICLDSGKKSKMYIEQRIHV